MNQTDKSFISFKAAFFMLIALAFGGVIIGSFIGMALFLGKSGGDLQAVSGLMNDPSNFRMVQIVQTITAICGMLLPTLYVAKRLSSSPLQLSGLKVKTPLIYFAITLGITVLGIFLSSGLGYLSYQLPLPESVINYFTKLETDYTTTVLNIIKVNNIGELLISIVVLALVPAICEEVLFRGGLQNYLTKWTGKPIFSIIIVSLIFSAVHFSGFGFLSRFALGMILGFLFYKTGNLWTNIITHFINNAIAVIMVYAYSLKGKPLAEVMTDKSGSYAGLLAIIGIVYFFTLIKSKPSAKEEITHGV